MHCNGKCYLMKKLAAAAETEKPASSDKKHTPVIETSDLFFSALANYDVLFIANPFKASLNAGYSDLYHNPIHFSVFHPPIITA
ncbi:MAG: hypothetical protein CFE23_13210 [Flavobacterium sp. BFFFF1]|nr:MAG: hypothetical protein CFE23_13210 [Flavobacterium sp. BFFFF1]